MECARTRAGKLGHLVSPPVNLPVVRRPFSLAFCQGFTFLILSLLCKGDLVEFWIPPLADRMPGWNIQEKKIPTDLLALLYDFFMKYN